MCAFGETVLDQVLVGTGSAFETVEAARFGGWVAGGGGVWDFGDGEGVGAVGADWVWLVLARRRWMREGTDREAFWRLFELAALNSCFWPS